MRGEKACSAQQLFGRAAAGLRAASPGPCTAMAQSILLLLLPAMPCAWAARCDSRPTHHTATCRGRPLSRGELWIGVPGGFKQGTCLGITLSPTQRVSVPCAGMCGRAIA